MIDAQHLLPVGLKAGVAVRHMKIVVHDHYARKQHIAGHDTLAGLIFDFEHAAVVGVHDLADLISELQARKNTRHSNGSFLNHS